MTDQNTLQCLNCDTPETQIPLLNLRYDGKEGWICSQCIPVLIHKPHELAGKLKGAEEFPGVDIES